MTATVIARIIGGENMKSCDKVFNEMLNVLLELEDDGAMADNGGLKVYLTGQLSAYVDILDNDLPEEYYDRISKFIAL